MCIFFFRKHFTLDGQETVSCNLFHSTIKLKFFLESYKRIFFYPLMTLNVSNLKILSVLTSAFIELNWHLHLKYHLWPPEDTSVPCWHTNGTQSYTRNTVYILSCIRIANILYALLLFAPWKMLFWGPTLKCLKFLKLIMILIL